jgi:hypothetical protein
VICFCSTADDGLSSVSGGKDGKTLIFFPFANLLFLWSVDTRIGGFFLATLLSLCQSFVFTDSHVEIEFKAKVHNKGQVWVIFIILKIF